METKTVSMDGAAWLASFIVLFARDKFIEKEMAGIAFKQHPGEIRKKMLGQVWDIAAKIEGIETVKPVKKKK